MEHQARPQIFRYVTKDKVLDVGDLLDADPKRSKVRFILLHFGPDFKATTRALHYADADDLEVVCWDILQGTFQEWTDHKGSIRDGACHARVLNLRKDLKYKNPYALEIRNGPGQVIGRGAVKLLKADVSVGLLLPEFDARRLCLTVLDYIRAWKQANFAELAVPRVAPRRVDSIRPATAVRTDPLAAVANSAPAGRSGTPLPVQAPAGNGSERPASTRGRPSVGGRAAEATPPTATGSQVAFLVELAADLGHRGERGRQWLAEQCDQTPAEHLTRAQASQLIERLLALRETATQSS
jgi:hypothetical protein